MLTSTPDAAMAGLKTLHYSWPIPLSGADAPMIPVLMGAIVGLYFFFRGCILLQRRAGSPGGKAPVLNPLVAISTSSDHGPPRAGSREIVRLSPDGDPDTSTQQGRIAAALLRAGATSPESWTAMEDRRPAGVDLADEQLGVAARPGGLVRSLDLTASNALKRAAGHIQPPTPSPINSGQTFRWKPALMAWGGPTLALLCLYILAQHFGLL